MLASKVISLLLCRWNDPGKAHPFHFAFVFVVYFLFFTMVNYHYLTTTFRRIWLVHLFHPHLSQSQFFQIQDFKSQPTTKKTSQRNKKQPVKFSGAALFQILDDGDGECTLEEIESGGSAKVEGGVLGGESSQYKPMTDAAGTRMYIYTFIYH